ncbi:MAG: ABC transporter ATP-binding protein [Solirubrobacteraceae bacterium]
MLEIDSLQLRYGSTPVVRGVSIEVGRGEVVGLVGPNGAGKSSTTLAVMGAVPAASGDIRLDGVSLRGQSPERIVRAGVALVPEGRHIFGALTVEENLRLGLVGRGTQDGVEEDVDWIHSLFPVVRDFSHRHAGGLSGGQQQQVAIARALLAKPRVLLLDEPSLGLAPSVVDTVWEALSQIRRKGVTIMLVEQRAQITVAFADRTYLMSNGEIKAELTPADTEDTSRMISAYFGS